MSGVSANRNGASLATDLGIAIGPILFIIAVLGILAAAIAAGSGSFTSNTGAESNRTKAAALIEIGQSLKIGFERMVVGSDTTKFEDVNIDSGDTTAVLDLFSPVGGGIPAPSITMSKDPSEDLWYYPLIYIPALGLTSAACPAGSTCGSRVALLRVTPGVCDEINLKANAIALTATPGGTVTDLTSDLGDFTDAAATLAAGGAGVLDPGADWGQSGKTTGCVYNTAAASAEPLSIGYFFYQVLAVR